MTNHEPTVTTVVRLSPEAYRQLEKAVGGYSYMVTSQTTDLQVAEAVGIQRVLKALRDGFVIS